MASSTLPYNPYKICILCQKSMETEKEFSKKVYGMLDNCNHAFHVECIRQERWKQQVDSFRREASSSRHRYPFRDCHLNPLKTFQCPVCQEPSDLIMATKILHFDLDVKARFMLEFLKNVEGIECEYVRKGIGPMCMIHPGDGGKKCSKKSYSQVLKNR